MTEDEARQRLAALGLRASAVDALAAHFADAERRGKPGHGFARVEWLATLDLDPAARPRARRVGGGLRALGRARRARLPRARRDRARDARRSAGARPRRGRAALLPERRARATGCGGWPRAGSSPRSPRPRRVASRIRTAASRSPGRIRSRSRSRRATGRRSSRTSRWGRSRTATSWPACRARRARAVRRRAGAQGVRAGGRARAARLGARRARARARCSSSRVRITIPCRRSGSSPRAGVFRATRRLVRALAEPPEHERVDRVLAVDALLEVLDPRPVLEAFVAEDGQAVGDLLSQPVVDLDPLRARRLAEELLVDAEETAKLSSGRSWSSTRRSTKTSESPA